MNCSRSLSLLASLAITTIATSTRAQSSLIPPDAPAAAPAAKDSAPPSTRPAADIEVLLKDMSSDDWKLRQQAADAIGDLDPAMLPRLRKAIEATTDVDLHSALLTAVKRVEDKAMIMPSLVTLHLKDAAPLDALNQLAAQLNFDLVADSTDWLGEGKVNIDADHLPFWTVMKMLSPQWPVKVVSMPTDPSRLSLVGTGNNLMNDRSTVAGSFLICPTTLTTNANIDLLPAVPEFKSRSYVLHVAVLAEPKLRASRISLAVKEAIDENGKSLKPAENAAGNPNAVFFNGMQGGTSGQQPALQVRMSPPPDAGKTIAKMSGVVRCRVPTRTQHVEVGDLADGKEHTVDLGGRQLKVTVTATDKQYDVKILMAMGNTNPNDEQSMAMLRDMNLIDADGNSLYRRGISPFGNNARNWVFGATFSREGTAFGRKGKVTGEAVKLVWDVAVETKDMETPFELVNIPIP